MSFSEEESVETEPDNHALLERTRDLEDRLTLLEKQFDQQRAEQDTTSKPRSESKGSRFYAVLRGRFDEDKDDFMSDIYDNVAAHNDAMVGAKHFKGQSFSSYHKAQEYYRSNIEAVRTKNLDFRDERGRFSFHWYAVWNVQTGETHTVPEYEDALQYVNGSPVWRHKRFSSFPEARKHCELEKDRARNQDQE